MGGMFSAPALPSIKGGGGGGDDGGSGKAKKKVKVKCTCAKFTCGTRKYRDAKKKNKGLKCARKGLTRRCKKCGGGRVSGYEEAYGEDYEDYEDYEDFTEERVMSYGEEYAPPGTLMSEKFVPGTYMTSSYINLTPEDFPTSGQSASVTKTGKPTKPPTAGKSKYANESSTLGINLSDAMPLSPMVERTVTDSFPMNFSVVLLTILFIVFVMMRK
jgi:hypothetical protein